ncbi:MAG: biotin--[acetyl-CoA-carboxylase] ligase [Acidimicrobiales bacterium]|jgi:BirA family biotin operon repressor/biotin-[acetyl-CoA-carboxylase] ligase
MPGSRFTDIRRFESIDSTNRYLLEEARRGAADGVVAVADHQSAGRGRLGRRWEAPPGSNLLVSVLLRPDLPAGQRQLACGVVALAAIDAVASVTGLDVAIKWPNDLLGADGRKLAGVLAETDVVGSPAGSALRAPIVVGIGINVNWPGHDRDLPTELVGSATSLRQQAGRPVDRTELFDALLDALGPRAADLESVPGRARQAGDFRARCTTLGAPVRVELADERFEGLATDLTPEGHLVVEVSGATRTVVTGDVVHVRTTG